MLRATTMASLMAVALGCAAPALADEGVDHGLGLSVGAIGGTNGLGLEVGYRLTNHFGVRANYASYNYSKSTDSGDFDIDGKARLKSSGLLLDVFPFGGSFRLSVGMRSNKNRFAGIATPTTATVDVGGDTYTASQVGTLTGEAGFKKNSPTATLGWGGKFKTGLHFGFEVGVVAQGSPKLSATSSGSLASNPTFQSSLNDQLAEWEDDSKDYKLWPVIQLHLSYRF
jgi:hypothetical protein